MKQPFSPMQFEEQRLLHVKHSQLLTQQEKYWRQPAKTMWLKDGDRNSAYFHRKASNRRSKNTIKSLTNEAGEWQSEPVIIKGVLMDYYQKLFTTKGTGDEAILEIISATSMRVTSEMNADLLQPYFDEEIKATLFQMHPSKSPGSDGTTYSPSFYILGFHIVALLAESGANLLP
ncbi:uncharacterized protein LOC121049214 [Rosa chinensis]|uniref:uncharacterized protein LOC121049214 n=1 Tax=Rosa chinensis TaxID=74649 RepID=UPI001AD8D866|nr:uncharacterized protein LOC121049214 [Rosa chinensis]